MNDPIETRLNELREIAKKYANAFAEREYLENFKHSKRAILMKEAERRGFTTSASQEREAFADPAYTEVLEGLRAATEKSEALKWELKIAEIGADLWRSKMANERAERQRYGA